MRFLVAYAIAWLLIFIGISGLIHILCSHTRRPR